MSFILLAFLPFIQATCPKDQYSPVNEVTKFSLPKLPYQYNSLQPQYWSQILLFHHDNVHASIVSSLNDIISTNSNYQKLTITQLIMLNTSSDSELSRYAGGHYSHCLFWLSLISYKCANQPSGLLLIDIEGKWGTFSNFQSSFNTNAYGLFGSGWA